jgi:hypothetical protein
VGGEVGLRVVEGVEGGVQVERRQAAHKLRRDGHHGLVVRDERAQLPTQRPQHAAPTRGPNA